MKEESNIKTIDIFGQSIKLGIKVGFALSSIYAAAGMIIFILPMALSELNLETIGVIILITMFIFFYTVLPSTVIGLLTGIIVGRIAKLNFTKKIPMMGFALISLAICGLLALIIHIIWKIDIVWSLEQIDLHSADILFSYPFIFGVPTIIYILAGGWFGRTIHSRFLTS